MKKLFAVTLILCMMTSCALATDYSAMTDDQLLAEMNTIRNELNKRLTKAEKNATLIEQNGIRLYTTGKVKYSDMNEYTDSIYVNVEVVFVNDTDKDLGITTDNVVINGWTVTALVYAAANAHTRTKTTFDFDISLAEIEKIEEVEEIVLDMHTFDTSSYMTIDKIKNVKFSVN